MSGAAPKNLGTMSRIMPAFGHAVAAIRWSHTQMVLACALSPACPKPWYAPIQGLYRGGRRALAGPMTPETIPPIPVLP